MSNDKSKNSKEGGGVISTLLSPDDVIKQQVYLKYARFMSLPDPDKAEMLGIPVDEKTGRILEKPTAKKFAKAEGVSERTLSLWKKRRDFQNAVVSLRKEWGTDLTSNVMASLYRNCILRGNAYDIELWLAYMENWDRKQVVKIVQEKFDANDLRVIIGRLPKEQQNEWYVKIGELITLAELQGGDGEVSKNSA